MIKYSYIIAYAILTICFHSSSLLAPTFNKNYSIKSYQYNILTGVVTEKTTKIKRHYRVGLVLDSPIFSTPITGLLYKVYHLSKAMIQRGHSYVFFICNRNFKTKKDIEALKIENIKVHLLDETLFYDKSYMEKIIKEEKIDILQYEVAQTFLSLGMPLKVKTSIPVVLTLHDIEDELMDQLGKHEHKNILNYLHYISGHLADSLVTLTPVDKEKRIACHGIPQDKIFVIPIGVDNTIAYKGMNSDDRIIGLVGNQFYEPNKRASIFLIDKILPIIKQRYYDTKVKIIGMVPNDLKNLYKDRADVIFTGAIENNTEYIKELSSFTIGTCCIDAGVGMNVKVSNYCAIGLPVILTPICHKGYENITSLKVVGLESEKISDEIIKMFEDKDYATKLGRLNNELIFKHLSWGKIAIKLEQALNYAYSHGEDEKQVEIKPIWMLEKRHDRSLLQGHHIIDSKSLELP